MDAPVVVMAAVGAYLAGSISFARVVGRRVAPGDDLSTTHLELPGGAEIEYSGVSATAIAARTGPTWAMVVGFGDMAKAFVPTLAARLVWPDESYHLVVAVFAMAGHVYPVYHRFKGGRGMASLFGGLLAIDWLALPVTTALGIGVGLFVIRDIFAAYTLGQWFLIPWFLWRGGTPEVAYAVAVNLLFVIATIPEIRQHLAKRRAVERVASWSAFMKSYPALGSSRVRDEAGDEASDPAST